MPDLLNGVASGAGPGPSNMVIMRGGRYSKTVVTNVPGAEVTSTNGIPNNLVAYMAGVFHSALTEVWATAIDDGTATPPWVTRNSERVAGGDTGRSGFQPCLTSAGPGLVHAWINPATGFTRVARWDALTNAITLFDQPSGFKFDGDELGPGMVVGNLYFVGGKDGGLYYTQVFNIESGAFSIDALGFSAVISQGLATVGGNVYSAGKTGFNRAFFAVWLGSWVQVAETVSADMGAQVNGITGWLCYARKGKVYFGHKVNAGDGLTLLEYDPAVPGVINDVTSILDGTIQAGINGIPTTNDWKFGFYVDVDTIGEPRYMIQLVPARKTNSPGCVLYEHTDAGVILIGNTDIALGTNCVQQAPYCVAGLTFTEGNLWAVKVAEPTPDPLGMLLTFRIGGDPGPTDTVIRLSIASPLGAPEDRANTLVAPVGGLGQAGASLFDEGGGVFRVDGWNADPGAGDLTVVHRTIPDGFPNGVLTDWTIKASKS